MLSGAGAALSPALGRPNIVSVLLQGAEFAQLIVFFFYSKHDVFPW